MEGISKLRLKYHGDLKELVVWCIKHNPSLLDNIYEPFISKKEIKKFLDNTKVYVNEKSEEIQRKLFSFGIDWYGCEDKKVRYTKKPFLFISDCGEITYSDNIIYFKNQKCTEITAEQILSLELTEDYRTFKDKNECWNEMLKHQPFGWVKSKDYGYFSLIAFVRLGSGDVMITFAKSEQIERSSRSLFENFIFADGAPFGIKEE